MTKSIFALGCILAFSVTSSAKCWDGDQKEDVVRISTGVAPKGAVAEVVRVNDGKTMAVFSSPVSGLFALTNRPDCEFRITYELQSPGIRITDVSPAQNCGQSVLQAK